MNKLTLCVVPERQRSQWDKFVAEHSEGHLLQSWNWGELKAFSGWSPLRLGLWDGECMVAAAQVLRRTMSHVPLRLGHMAYIPKGPVIDWSQATLVETFFSLLHAYLRKQGALTLHIDLGLEQEAPNDSYVMQYLTQSDLHPVRSIQPRRTIVLDLSADEETLLSQMKPKCRYNIGLAARKGVAVRVATSLEEVREWYKLYLVTGARDNFGIHTLDYYLRVWELFAACDELRLLLAEHDGKLLGGIFVALFAGQAIYLYGASSNEERQRMPNYALQWEAIRWAKRHGAHLYDFWGIPDTDDAGEAMEGVYRFKRGWGGRLTQFLGGYEYVYHPLVMSLVKKRMLAASRT
ncbi:MAG TPA: peptidoglycan bridge formation glycyltransferase FemA/FemB family protein [Ktedonobacteraceae bacterium]|jgi:lipid II:glycine glycyltransferase (peptidoglycan interpeptide bridge formation enzyme)